MYRNVCLATALALMAAAPALHSQGQDKTLADLMQRKLKFSQTILEGVAVNDFAKITDGARELIEVSKAAEWRAIKTPRYELHTNEFRRNAETLIQAAKDKNIDAAALAYVDLTLTCVKCHKYTREVRMSRRD